MLTNLNNEIVNAQIFKNFDVAIVGAGAAGITLTKELSSLGKNVALIEAGDYEYSDESQEIYIAKTKGDHLKRKILKEDISEMNINGQLH